MKPLRTRTTAAVLEAVKAGARTTAELIACTGFCRSQIHWACRELILRGWLTRAPLRDGRPGLRYQFHPTQEQAP